MNGLFGANQQSPIGTQQPAIYAIRIQTSAFGVPIALCYGKNRLTGNLLWYGDFQAQTSTEPSQSGGKGGGDIVSIIEVVVDPIGTAVRAGLDAVGAPGVVQDIFDPIGAGIQAAGSALGLTGKGGQSAGAGQTRTNYYASLAFGTAEGPIGGVGIIWASKKATSLAELGLTLFTGTYPQTPWGYLTTNHPGQDLGYTGLAYVAVANFALDGNANLPNFSYELIGRLSQPDYNGDALPDQIIPDFLTSPYYGVGLALAQLGNVSRYATYCKALGLFISPCLVAQEAAVDILTRWLALTNAAAFWSEGQLQIAPYGDQAVSGNGVTFTPDLTPLYSLTDDDYLYEAGQDPVTMTRTPPADAYNCVRVEFLNRANAYNPEPAEAKDDVAIALYGLRVMPTVTAHEIGEASIARTVAQLTLQRQLYVRNQYRFKLPWKYVLLDPMDPLAITDAGLGLSAAPVRIVKIEEDESCNLDVTVEDLLNGAHSTPRYGSQSALGFAPDYQVAPGSINLPLLFEPPPDLLSVGLELWMAISGGPTWGGCEVWISVDDATYRKIAVVNGNARQGTLSATLPSGADPDLTDTLHVDLAQSRGALFSGTKDDADHSRTLCYCDGELLAYETATLTGTNKYDLTYLRRGIYDTPIGAHLAGRQFARLDQAITKFGFSADQIGKPLYLKFPSFNLYSGAKQSTGDVPAYTYYLTGAALLTPLANVHNMTTVYLSNLEQIHWDAVEGKFRSIDYEVRLGLTWATAQVLGRTPLTTFPTFGNGPYWVAAHYGLPNGIDVYSATPTELIIAGSALTKNVIAIEDEAATGWGGTVSGGAVVTGAIVQLGGAGNILAEADFLSLSNVLYDGGVAPSGTYQIPTAHQIHLTQPAACSILITRTFQAVSIFDNVLTISDFLSMTDVLNAALGPVVNAQPQIRLAQDDGIFGSWQNYIPGVYLARHFDARVVLTSADPQVTCQLSGFTFAVDVPDRTDTGTNVSIPAGGIDIIYATPFNGGPAGSPTPNTHITILSAQQGDDVVVTSQTLAGFHLQILNGGVSVARAANWLSQGY